MSEIAHSGHSHEIVCPNCGHHATGNFCAQCGQPTHLHGETFWGLVMHFVGHYFHYDSKFWKTLKTLWFRPGALTEAYLKKQRMRFIPPISLYIFLSAVFFLSGSLVSHQAHPVDMHQFRTGVDSIDQASYGTPSASLQVNDHSFDSTYFGRKMALLKAEHHERAGAYLWETVVHNFPKLFFFLIPLVALFLKVLFLRRRSALFVHHAVFSLHIHSFVFSVLLLQVLNPFHGAVTTWLRLIIFLSCIVYFVAALRRVYHIGYARALFSTVFIGIGYMFCMVLTFLGAVAAVLIAA